MLLAYLLLFPDIGSEFSEDLADWKTHTDYQTKTLTTILDILATDPDITADRLKEYLQATVQSEIYDVLSAEIEMLTRKNPLPQEAQTDIALLIKGMRKKALRSELQLLAEKITEADENETKELWEKYPKLLQEEKELA